MPVSRRWYKFNLENIRKLPRDLCGAYELANRDKRIIDIGGSSSLRVGIRGRLMSHLRNNRYPTARYFRYTEEDFLEDGISIEASLSKKFQDKHGRKPRYTKRSPKPIWSIFDL